MVLLVGLKPKSEESIVGKILHNGTINRYRNKNKEMGRKKKTFDYLLFYKYDKTLHTQTLPKDDKNKSV